MPYRTDKGLYGQVFFRQGAARQVKGMDYVDCAGSSSSLFL